MTESNYFLCRYRLDHRERYFLWYGGETDHIHLDRSRIITFSSDKTARYYAVKHALKLSAEKPSFYNLDEIANFCSHPSAEAIKCKRFLNVWNLFLDVNPIRNKGTGSFQVANRKRYASHIYEKLFYGSNLPSITPRGKHYTPIWLKYEIKQLAKVMRVGIDEFKSKIYAG